MNGDELRQWREARGLSINALAALLGRRASTVMRWERGRQNDSALMLDLALCELDRRLTNEREQRKMGEGD